MHNPPLVFVGTYSEPVFFGTGEVLRGQGRGIHCFTLDPRSGVLTPKRITEGVRNASYLVFDPSRRVLYCVNEFKEFEGAASGAVSAFAINHESGELTFLNMKASHGTDPCHLVVDATGRYLLVANYASGSLCVLPLNSDGSLADASQVVQHEGSSVDPKRQTGPHAHAVVIDKRNRFVFATDLGLDKVMIYRLDSASGTLVPNEEQPFVETAPGAGPRQLALHPSGRFAYLINELDSTMTAFAYDQEGGRLEALQTLSTLPPDFAGHNTGAEVRVAPSGRFLYGSNRGHDSIVVYAVDEDTGTLAPVGHQSTQGHMPRNFDIDRSGAFLAAANQDTDNVVMFRVDLETGLLAPTGHSVGAGTPVCVRFL